MSAMAETATAMHVGSLTDLPTERVRAIYSYGHRMLVTTPVGHVDEAYYGRMVSLAAAELSSRDDQMAENWRASFAN